MPPRRLSSGSSSRFIAHTGRALWTLAAISALASCGATPDDSGDEAATQPTAAPHASATPTAEHPPPEASRTLRRFGPFALDEYALSLHTLPGLSANPPAIDGEVVFNAGFFDRDGEPMGYGVSEGERVSGYRAALGGGVLTVSATSAQLHDGEAFEAPTEPPEFAVQCRPRLVVDGRVNIRSESGHRAARTALCIRDDGRALEVFVDASTPGPTLLELARTMQEAGCEEALNLDGGPSTMVRTAEFSVPPRGPIRQLIAVRRRASPEAR